MQFFTPKPEYYDELLKDLIAHGWKIIKATKTPTKNGLCQIAVQEPAYLEKLTNYAPLPFQVSTVDFTFQKR